MRSITEIDKPIALLDADRFAWGETLDERFPCIDRYQWETVRALGAFFPGKIIPITNRPGGIAQKFADFVGSGVAFGESGAALVLCGTRWVNEKFMDYAQKLRPQIIRIVNEQIRTLGFEGAIRELDGNLVTACFYPHALDKGTVMPRLNDAVIEAVDKQGLQNVLSINPGTRLDISPRGLTKEQALLVLATGIYSLVYNRGVPWDMLILGDDSRSAIPLFDTALQLSRGQAKLITTANADGDLQHFVAQKGGYVSTQLFAKGVEDGLNWALNSLGIKKQQGVWTVTK